MTADKGKRRPRAFSPDDPSLIPETSLSIDDATIATSDKVEDDHHTNDPTSPTSRSVAGWGTIFITAIAGLILLASTVWISNLVSDILVRNDWIGWTALTLLGIATLAALAVAISEFVGLLNLRSLQRIRTLAERCLANHDKHAERKTIRHLMRRLAGRKDLAWPIARFKDHLRDVHDPGDLLRIVDREIMAPLDRTAKHLVFKSARRVSVVTAVSPTGLISVMFVLIENLRLLRSLATLYGGRPGFIGSMKLVRMVFLHIVATGGLALTDDLFGQFIGQDILRRLSRRLGEGVFNGALTARIGLAALSLIRPLPFIATEPPRIRSILSQVFAFKS